jgi:hypothetical protein
MSIQKKKYKNLNKKHVISKDITTGHSAHLSTGQPQYNDLVITKY